MEYIAHDARNCGFKRLEAYPNRQCLCTIEFEKMVQFYEKQGFTTVVKRDAWHLMQKEL